MSIAMASMIANLITCALIVMNFRQSIIIRRKLQSRLSRLEAIWITQTDLEENVKKAPH